MFYTALTDVGLQAEKKENPRQRVLFDVIAFFPSENFA